MSAGRSILHRCLRLMTPAALAVLLPLSSLAGPVAAQEEGEAITIGTAVTIDSEVLGEERRVLVQPAGRLLHEGGNAFRVEGASSIRVVFDGGGERATSYVAFTGMMHTRGVR